MKGHQIEIGALYRERPGLPPLNNKECMLVMVYKIDIVAAKNGNKKITSLLVHFLGKSGKSEAVFMQEDEMGKFWHEWMEKVS